MNSLPSNPDLIQRTKALAALDLIMSPEWDGRYYSFNSAWSPSEQMASMRDGCGDEWWIVFHTDGWAALKGLGHESSAWSKGREQLSTDLQRTFPPELAEFAREPAFRWDATSFAGYRLQPHSDWIWSRTLTRFSALDGGESELLSLLSGTPQDYVDFAASYYEADVPVEIVQQFFCLAPITTTMISSLNLDTELSAIHAELFDEIAYPRN
jgi:hypothetical protein